MQNCIGFFYDFTFGTGTYSVLYKCKFTIISALNFLNLSKLNLINYEENEPKGLPILRAKNFCRNKIHERHCPGEAVGSTRRGW